jgi:hypothetical protein
MKRRDFLRNSTGSVFGLLAAGTLCLDGHADEPSAGDGPRRKAPAWKPLFDGKTLTGWKPDGKAVWTVENGCIVGVQGPGNAPGDLFTEEEYGDFELRVTYKIQWPANSGVWFRYQTPDKSYQADILEFKDPEAYSGTLYCPGKMFLFINKAKDLEKHNDWNTMLIRAEGDSLGITLNGVTTGQVKDASFDTGRIGFQVHPGEEFKNMKVTVREVMIKDLSK